jgi:hypothetical protein
VPSHILVNNLGLTYKGTIGVSTATLPDVCKTPSPGGPVPIPYPNFANQSSLQKGTKTVKAKGKMIAIKGSEYSMSFGDEPGTVGGVTSNTFKKETSWITYSFDVKMDGKNACRHTDKKFHNHKNTVDLAGNIDPALIAEIRDMLCAEFCKELKNGGTRSYDLEQRLRNNEEFKDLDVKFAPDTAVDHTFAGVERTTIPDAALIVDGNIVQCFDFKFPGDRWRGDQYERQTRLAKRVPIEISESECGC